ncbi:SAM-dependent methyltransferase PA0798 (UbiE paralog) [hydrothermal vent metagenome]|uniref:SAM-dependent methyltransferase PA0798 (UbiE paralog) n=1 Tax=hydrothermal vent metagenome TaxID=652676 RepID=A0A3B0RZ60_9ZZZZ
MGFYNQHIMPKLVNLACSSGQMKKVRSQTIPLAKGDVLEIGFGSGLNLPFYDGSQINRLLALEPEATMRKQAQSRLAEVDFDCQTLDLEAEAIPLDAASMDMVVVTFALCTIPDVNKALSEMRRVIKPGGTLIFAEHGQAPDAGVARWQRRIEPLWKNLGGGCHLTRKPVELISTHGFAVQKVNADYLAKAPKFAGYVSFGTAEAV